MHVASLEKFRFFCLFHFLGFLVVRLVLLANLPRIYGLFSTTFWILFLYMTHQLILSFLCMRGVCFRCYLLVCRLNRILLFCIFSCVTSLRWLYHKIEKRRRGFCKSMGECEGEEMVGLEIIKIVSVDVE